MWRSFENNYFGAVLCNVRRNLIKEICKAANGNASAKRAKVLFFIVKFANLYGGRWEQNGSTKPETLTQDRKHYCKT